MWTRLVPRFVVRVYLSIAGLCSVVELATIFLSSGFAGLQTCSSAACSASGATSLGLRIFRNTPTLLNQAEYRSMTTEAPRALLEPCNVLSITRKMACLSWPIGSCKQRSSCHYTWTPCCLDYQLHCGDCEFEASTCASLALSWWGGAWLEMAWSLCFLAEKLVNIWWTLRLKRVPLHWWNPAFTPTFKSHVLGANRSWRFWCFIRGMCRTQSCLAEARVSSCGNDISLASAEISASHCHRSRFELLQVSSESRSF